MSRNTEIHLLQHRRITDEGCWEWTRSCQSKGYGQVMVAGKMRLVHRVAAEIWNGFDPASGLQVLHRCDNPPCFNPAHLFEGTAADNSADMVEKGRARGKPHPRISDEIVAEIVARGRMSERAAARETGVSRATVRSIRDGSHWSSKPCALP